MRLISGFLVSLSVLSLGGCYGFAGGGLPPSIRTVAVLPFDNQTAEPTLTQEVTTTVREAVEGRLGLRQASERQADAVVRGTITRYEPDLPVAYTGNEADGDVTVTRRLVQITVSVEILDQHAGKPLWERSGLLLEGDYEPGQEAQGKERALDKLVTNIVEGAQSQW
ncbi:MAG: LPS assembly lipoprotein LptE [Gemmatimonadales bacterium]